MKDSIDGDAGSATNVNGQDAALQVVCLGASGGPSEDGVTGFLVRSIGSEWARGSILAVDAGSHFAPINRIMEKSFPTQEALEQSNAGRTSKMTIDEEGTKRPSVPGDGDEALKPKPTVLTSGPFAGVKLPYETAGANALHFLRTFVSTYLITHPHLDHISGFVINTAAFHATSRPKTLAALSSTVDAMKRHIFNDVIWPNLTDEDGGVGFVTFQRLKEGGDIMLGEGEGRGYIDVCDGLGVRAWKVSHGNCTKPPQQAPQFRSSVAQMWDPRASFNGLPPGFGGGDPRASFASLPPGFGGLDPTSNHGARHMSMALGNFPPTSSPGLNRGQSYTSGAYPSSYNMPTNEGAGVVDSTAYFIRDWDTQREVLIFGDVEPDSISMAPRNHVIWQEAARKIAYGLLRGIFIECSYDDSQGDTVLFGHLCPRHMVAELQTLAGLVREEKESQEMEQSMKKRKRSSAPNGLLNSVPEHPENERKRNRNSTTRPRLSQDGARGSGTLESGIADLGLSSSTSGGASGGPPRVSVTVPQTQQDSWRESERHDTGSPRSPFSPAVSSRQGETPPLAGVRVIIIHVKDTYKDGPHVSENILTQLNEYEERLQEQNEALGCEFVIARTGESYSF